MLAEELMQFARRTLWDERDGGFFEHAIPAEEAGAERAKPFALNCEAARVLCRLDVLHHDAEYREGAVMADASDYAGDAARTLVSQTSNLRVQESGLYGVALGRMAAIC